jgi:hypothetical protein
MDWQSAFQGSAIHRRESAARVHVDMLQSVGIRKTVVKSVVEGIDVRNPRVVNVHVAEIAPSGAIPGDKRFAESERAPSEASAVSKANSAKANSDTPARTAVPAD